jgi:DNA-binding transcriptional MerR regulator
MVETWTIAELAEAAGKVLYGEPGGQGGPVDGRVREVPNERSIRWYTTIGLLDPPLSRRGRVARYGRRHLLQLLAVKRRQAEGHALADIQAELMGATDSALEHIARAHAAAPTPAEEHETPARFWASGDGEPRRAAASPHRAPPGTTFTGLTLAPGVALLLQSSPRPLTDSDARALTTAADELLRIARERGLAPIPDHDGGTAP